MENYLEKYSGAKTPKFQEGGAMPAPEAAAPAGGAPDLEGMLMQYAETRDPQMAVAVCDALLAQMGGGAPAEPTPEMGYGGRMDTAAPRFKKGGKL
jgi:hypothetical protein